MNADLGGRKARIVIADDHRILAETLSAVLGQQFEVAGICANGRELLKTVASFRPDVAIIDISMPEMNGFEAARRIRTAHPGVRIVFLTMHAEQPYVDEAFRLGAAGYVLKTDSLSELIRAVRAVLSNDRFVSASATKPLTVGRTGADLLTPRQREVLQLVAEAKSAKQIATLLNISPKTVEFHKAIIMDRLGLRTTAEIVRYALQNHLVGN